MKYRMKAGIVLPITDIRRINMVTLARIFLEVCLECEILPLSRMEAALAFLFLLSFWEDVGPLIFGSIGRSVGIIEVDENVLLGSEVVLRFLIDLVTDFVLQKRMI